MKILLIVEETTNPWKREAVKDLMMTLARNSDHSFELQELQLADLVDVRPLTLEDTVTASQQVATRLMHLIPIERRFEYSGNILTLGIQQGNNIFDPDKKVQMFHAVTVYSHEDRSFFTKLSTRAPVKDEARTMVKDRGMDLYEIWGKLYGEAVKDKKVSMYQEITGRSASAWMQETMEKALWRFI